MSSTFAKYIYVLPLDSGDGGKIEANDGTHNSYFEISLLGAWNINKLQYTEVTVHNEWNLVIIH